MLSKQFILLYLVLICVPAFHPSVGLAQESCQGSAAMGSPLSDARIEEADIRQLIERVTKAGKNKDVEALLVYFTPFTYSEFTVNTDAASEIVRLVGIDQHRAFFQETWQEVKSSEDIDDYSQISLSSDQKTALVRRSREINVTATDGKKILVQSESETRLGVVEGQLKIIAIKEVADIAVRPE